jgi:hypothetical protein
LLNKTKVLQYLLNFNRANQTPPKFHDDMATKIIWGQHTNTFQLGLLIVILVLNGRSEEMSILSK